MVWQLVCESVFECATFDLKKNIGTGKLHVNPRITVFRDHVSGPEKSMLNIIKHLKRCVYIISYVYIIVYII